MGKLESITTLATIAVGGLVFLKVYPLIEGFLKPAVGGAGGGGTGAVDFIDSLIPRFGEQPLRTFEPVPEVRPLLTEDTEVIPGTDFPVSPQRLQYQENIGVPFMFPEELQQPAPQAAPVLDWLAQVLPEIPQIPAATQQLSGQFWVNPITQQQIAPYVSGETPQAVLDLRAEDILPAIRGF